MTQNNTEKEIINKGIFTSYLKTKGENHKTYKRYGRKEDIIKDLEKGYLILSDGNNWDDKCDSSNFQKNTKGIKRYGLSFTYGNTENAAMWLLYADIKNKEGLMLSIPNKTILDIVNKSEEVELGIYQNKEFILKSRAEIKSIYLADLYYTSSTGREVIITTGDYRCRITKNTYYETIHLSKIYSWRFENECRLIVEIDERNNYNYNAARIKLNETERDFIFRECLVNDPVHDANDFKESKLRGSIRF